jgi:hypothetical protein
MTLDLWTSTSIGVTDSLGCTSILSFMTVKQRVLKILNGQYIMSSLTFDRLTSKSIGVIYSLGYTSALSLKSVEQRVFKILNRQDILMTMTYIDL